MFKHVMLPTLVYPTQHGNLLYSTPDLIQEFSKDYFAQTDIMDVVQKPFQKTPLKNLFRFPSQQLNIFSCRSVFDLVYGIFRCTIIVDS